MNLKSEIEKAIKSKFVISSQIYYLDESGEDILDTEKRVVDSLEDIKFNINKMLWEFLELELGDMVNDFRESKVLIIYDDTIYYNPSYRKDFNIKEATLHFNIYECSFTIQGITLTSAMLSEVFPNAKVVK